MNTEVILTKNIPGLGAEGDKVAVARGYARNYLLPRGLATLATAASVRHIELLKKKRAEREAAEKTAAEEMAQRIGRLTCTLTVKTGQDGKMFGAVTAGDIAEYLAREQFAVERKQVALEKPIQVIGEHHVAIHLAHGVTAQLKVVVVPAEPPPSVPAAAAERKGGRRTGREETRPAARADTAKASAPFKAAAKPAAPGAEKRR